MKYQKRLIVILSTLSLLLIAALPAHAATHRYDALGRLVGTTYESGATVTYAYDANGNMVAVTSVAGEHDTFMLTIQAGTGGSITSGASGQYGPGETVSIAATQDEGYIFSGWTATAGTFADAASAATAFTMPAEDAAVTAHFEPAASSIIGRILSYNPNNATVIQLMRDGEEIKRVYIGSETGSGQMEQGFEFKGVEPGTYSLVVTKRAHTKFTIRNIVVGEKTVVDLTRNENPDARLITLRCGDINGDGMANNADLVILWQQANYNKNALAADNPDCDLNGDGMVNNADLAILWLASNYNKGEVIVEWADGAINAAVDAH